MSKLPTNFVKAPVFDSPLRKTAAEPSADASALSVVPDTEPGPEEGRAVDVAPEAELEPEADEPAPKRRARRARASKPAAPAPASDDAEYRATVRLTHADYLALESEVHKRRMSGQKRASAAGLIREIVERWVARHTP